jgi:hypothetical protein
MDHVSRVIEQISGILRFSETKSGNSFLNPTYFVGECQTPREGGGLVAGEVIHFTIKVIHGKFFFALHRYS